MFELCQSGKQRRKNELFRRAEDITTKPVRLYEAGNGTQNSNEPKTDTMIKKELLLGDEAIAWGALNAGLSGVYAYPGTPLYGDHGIYPDAPPNARARHPLQLVGQRKDRTGSGPRHVVRRQAGPGLHEARGHERLRRRFRQFSHDGCQRRPGGRSGGRSLDALLAERTGLRSTPNSP